jgi:hypothetical protein
MVCLIYFLWRCSVFWKVTIAKKRQ